MKIMHRAIIGTTSLAASISVANVAMAEDKVLLKTPIAFSTNLPVLGSPIVTVSERLNKLSNGTIKIQESQSLLRLHII